MRSNFRFLLILIMAAGLTAIWLPNGHAQLPTEPPAPPPGPEPTTTVETGDLGGKHFGKTPDPAKTRRYYIAAEPELWDYAPQDKDPVCGMPLPPHVQQRHRGVKLRYVQYTDASFGTKAIPNPQLGVMGPVLRGMVGETLVVTFLNRCDRPLSMHPHGVKYDRDSEGAYTLPKPGRGAAVGPQARFTYVWHLDEQSGPMPSEPSSKGWLYHSHVSADEETLLGLVGSIIVTDPMRARQDGTPNDVDRELATLFMIFDESGLGEAEKEAAEYGDLEGNSPFQKTWAESQQMIEQGARFSINGYIYGNLPGLEMNEGERVRWYLYGLGSEDGFHTVHWHGMRVVEEGRRRTDLVELLPASMKVADMTADNPGTWLFQCHVAEHMMNGMFAGMTVHPKEGPQASRAREVAFLGMPGSQESLRISDVEARLASSPKSATPCEINLRGSLTVYDAFSIFTQAFEFRLGERTVTFKPDARGSAKVGADTFRVKNGGDLGVVYGGLLEFEIALRDASWLQELKKLGVVKGDTVDKATPMPVAIRVGKAQHETTVRASR